MSDKTLGLRRWLIALSAIVVLLAGVFIVAGSDVSVQHYLVVSIVSCALLLSGVFIHLRTPVRTDRHQKRVLIVPATLLFTLLFAFAGFDNELWSLDGGLLSWLGKTLSDVIVYSLLVLTGILVLLLLSEFYSAWSLYRYNTLYVMHKTAELRQHTINAGKRPRASIMVFALSVCLLLGWIFTGNSIIGTAMAFTGIFAVYNAIGDYWPATVIFLGVSNPDTIKFQSKLMEWATPATVISLLDLKNLDISSVQQYLAGDSFRTSNDEDWREMVRELLKFVPIIVVDLRGTTEAVDEEISWIKNFNVGFKTFVLIEHAARAVMQKKVQESGLNDTQLLSEEGLLWSVYEMTRSTARLPIQR